MIRDSDLERVKEVHSIQTIIGIEGDSAMIHGVSAQHFLSGHQQRLAAISVPHIDREVVAQCIDVEEVVCPHC